MIGNKFSLSIAAIVLLTTGCSQQAPKRATLAELDQASRVSATTSNNALSGSVDSNDAKAAYYQFLQSAPDSDRARNQALARLADLELKESHRWSDQDNYQEDRRYRDTLERTIELLKTALTEFPEAEGNDRKWYQLAKSHDQLGHHEASLNALQQLVNQHPDSPLYPEAQFRLAESAFSRGDYLAAEIAYTAALHSSRDTGFHERALFKRGWSRYKQSLIEPALEDFIAVIHAQEFPSAATLSETPLGDEDRVIYDEYYRSLALAMVEAPSPNMVTSLFRKHGIEDWYAPYRAASKLLHAQGRTSDAVAQWQHLLETQPDPWVALQARSEMVELWREGGFQQQAIAATEQLYQSYQQRAGTEPRSAAAEQSRTQLRQHWKDAARYHHARYQDSGKSSHFDQAKQWYERYLEHFDGYAQQDGIALAYGDLLAEAEHTEAAFHQCRRAAFDGTVILDPEAAYAALALLNTLTDQAPERWTDDYGRYAEAFARLYPNDERTPAIALNAAQYAYQAEHYDTAISLAHYALNDAKTQSEAYPLILQSQLNASEYANAEQTASRLLALTALPDSLRQRAHQQRALSVYRQAESAEQAKEWKEAIRHYQRIHEMDPNTDNAPKGLYNALSLAAEQAQWELTIGLIQRFQSVYPDHPLRADAERQLSNAYLASGQTEAAARQYEKLAGSEEDATAQRAAQWKAAQLYLDEKNVEGAINAFRRYAHSYPTPYPQNAEAMHQLARLYTQTAEPDKRQFWERKLLTQDRQQPDNEKTERTRRLAASAALSLARSHHEQYDNTPLSLPLENSLARKTEHMQSAIERYAQAASYGLSDVTSEATHRIGRIYETLARALLESDRPPQLSGETLIQYNILLEDRAFPFEDKAIEFYERNLKRARAEGFNEWMAQSRQRLAVLFPVRYAREPKARFTLNHSEGQTGTPPLAQQREAQP
ncbi:tetratricopeptide repeat protein [Marinimicrobium agarilyticum]|uniref:tetratricopeptide repeat protein n=1 Tax=Marinimicrobium agarilyticum TaxID=306546 RepID=UPI0004038521|nr:tetratricopeptide repeat protein [Marinimicrobium agarilyticum]